LLLLFVSSNAFSAGDLGCSNFPTIPGNNGSYFLRWKILQATIDPGSSETVAVVGAAATSNCNIRNGSALANKPKNSKFLLHSIFQSFLVQSPFSNHIQIWQNRSIKSVKSEDPLCLSLRRDEMAQELLKEY
jgi:hypothetical protein